jgi:hypothetical protein
VYNCKDGNFESLYFSLQATQLWRLQEETSSSSSSSSLEPMLNASSGATNGPRTQRSRKFRKEVAPSAMGSRAVSTGENKIISHYDIEQKVEQIAALRILRLYSTALKFKTLQYFFYHSVRLL